MPLWGKIDVWPKAIVFLRSYGDREHLPLLSAGKQNKERWAFTVTGAQPYVMPKTLCLAKAKKANGEPCAQPAMANGRCRLHGGLSLKGSALPQFVDGRHSKYMPQRLLAKYVQAEADENLIALRGEIAFVDVRVHELTEQLGTGESPKAWLAARGQVRTLQAEFGATEPDQDAIKAALARLSEIVDGAVGDLPLWAALFDAFETRRRLADTERKRLEALQASVSAAEAASLVQAVLNAVAAHVSSPTERSAITGELARLAGLGFARGAS